TRSAKRTRRSRRRSRYRLGLPTPAVGTWYGQRPCIRPLIARCMRPNRGVAIGVSWRPRCRYVEAAAARNDRCSHRLQQGPVRRGGRPRRRSTRWKGKEWMASSDRARAVKRGHEPANASDPLVGATIGHKFVLRERIGAGSMGAVYRADQTNLGRTVAVKVLSPDLAADEAMVRRFYEEA